MSVDFSRDVHCLLGLPFDAIDLAGAAIQVQQAIRVRKSCFLSTPNLTFLIGCLSDEKFRDSVINSDLSVADGMPLVWLSRLLNIPIRERVAGSTLFDIWRKDTSSRMSVFFFGGPDGVAEAACHRLSAEKLGMTCAGFESPGFGSLDDMSREDVITRINTSKPDFLLVALGAKKGQAWIERNRASLNVPVISHLGAVVNFVAGSVKRAPLWMQKTGLEWLWRILEEPALWRRYFDDGLALTRNLFTHVLPHALCLRIHAPSVRELAVAAIEVLTGSGTHELRLRGAWQRSNIAALRTAFQSAVETGKDIRLDLQAVTYVDSAFLGLTVLLYGHQKRQGKKLSVTNVQPAVRRLIGYSRADYLLKL